MMIESFNCFAYCNELFYFQEMLRAQRKKLKKAIKNEKVAKNNVQNKEQDEKLKHIYTLLDINVYLKCNEWASAADSIYQFLNNCV